MKQFAAIILSAIILNSFGFSQTILPIEHPFNPDSDGDEFVAVSDVLMSIASYDTDYSVEPMMVDSITFEEAMQRVLQKLDSLLSTTGTSVVIEDTNDGSDVDGNSVTTDSTWACGDPVNYWGFQYDTYLFGDQCWFQDNLRTTRYSNGDSLLFISQDTQTTLADVTEGACFISPSIYDDNLSINTFGLMYNWYAVADDRGVCPTNWHVPLLGEWESIQYGIGVEIPHPELLYDASFYPDISAFSTDGFFFNPTGLYDYNTSQGYDYTTYWTNTWVFGSPDLAWYVDLSFYGSLIQEVAYYEGYTYMSSATGIRCIKDAE